MAQSSAKAYLPPYTVSEQAVNLVSEITAAAGIYLRKAWIKLGPYHLTRFEHRNENSDGEPGLLEGERILWSMKIGAHRRICLVKHLPEHGIVHVAIACNDAYVFPAKVLISSILRYTKSPVKFHLFSTGLSEKCVAELHALIAKSKRGELQIFNNLEIDFPLSNDYPHLSKDTYLRFLIPDLLSELNRVIYLDIDLLIRGDIAELWKFDLKDTVLGGVQEEQMGTNGYPQSIGMNPGALYFNAGVLLMNLQKIREQKLADEWKQLAMKATYRFLDQDILNITCENQFTELPIFWNFNLHYYTIYKSQSKKAKIIHFTGPEKPWKFPDVKRRCNRDWWKEAKRV